MRFDYLKHQINKCIWHLLDQIFHPQLQVHPNTKFQILAHILYTKPIYTIYKIHKPITHQQPPQMNLTTSLFITLTLILGVTSTMNFQKNIWIYWETDIEQAPLVTRISYEKIAKAAEQAGWTLRLVNGETVKQYLPDYDRFEAVVKKGYRNSVQEKSDILRISLVEANGGIWVDFACILFEDLSWLSNQKLFEDLIINRIGSNKNDPDMLMLGEGYHQSPLSYYNEEGALVTDEYFGMAIHFIAAKKKSAIMTEWKQKMYRLTTLSFKQYAPQVIQKRLYYHNIERDDMYYSGNMALESVLQERQMEFDDQLTLRSERKNVYEHYKIWMFHGEVGPIAMTRKHLLNARDLFMDTREEIEQRAGKLWFFLKLAKFMREEIEDIQNVTEAYFAKNTLTIEQILTRGPTTEECKLHYIVEGSILHTFYKGSKYESQIKTPFITVAQRQQMKSHCRFVAPFVYYSMHKLKSEGQMVRPERELFANQSNTIGEKVHVWWVSNSLVVFAWLEWWRVFVYMFSGFVAMKFLSAKIRAMRQGSVDSAEQVNSSETSMRGNIGILEPKRRFRFNFPSSGQILAIITMIILTSGSLQFYEQLQDMGKYPQYECSLFALITIFIARNLLSLYTRSLPHPTFFNLPTLAKDFRFALYLPLAFSVFLHFDIIYGYAFYHSVVVVGGGLLVYGLLEELQVRGLSSKWLELLRKVIGLARWAALLVFGVFYVVGNLRYVRKDGRYVKQRLSEIVLSVFWPLFLLSIASILIQLIRKLLTPSSSSSFSSSSKSSKTSPSHATLYHLLLTTLTTLLVTYKSHLTYSTIAQSFSSYNNMPNFQVMMMMFTLCGVMARMEMPQSLSFSKTIGLWFVYAVTVNGLGLVFIVFDIRVLDFFNIYPFRYVSYGLLAGWFVICMFVADLINGDGRRGGDAKGTYGERFDSNQFYEVELSPKQ